MRAFGSCAGRRALAGCRPGFGNFLLATQKKVTAWSGAHPDTRARKSAQDPTTQSFAALIMSAAFSAIMITEAFRVDHSDLGIPMHYTKLHHVFHERHKCHYSLGNPGPTARAGAALACGPDAQKTATGGLGPCPVRRLWLSGAASPRRAWEPTCAY